MVIYQGPNKKRNYYESKFVRAGEVISVTEPGDTFTSHSSIAEEDGVFDDVMRFIQEMPEDVDAGYVSISNELEGGRILLNYDSFGFGIPKVPEARTNSVKVFQRLSPGYVVTADLERLGFPQKRR
jgi:hypothetical protein